MAAQDFAPAREVQGFQFVLDEGAIRLCPVGHAPDSKSQRPSQDRCPSRLGYEEAGPQVQAPRLIPVVIFSLLLYVAKHT